MIRFGVIKDADTGAPLGGTTVTIRKGGADLFSAIIDDKGMYSIDVPINSDVVFTRAEYIPVTISSELVQNNMVVYMEKNISELPEVIIKAGGYKWLWILVLVGMGYYVYNKKR